MCDQESKTRSGGFRRFMSAVIYCMRLSWETSPLYSLIRAFAYIANALLPFVTLYASKYLLDMLAAAGHAEQPFADAVFLLLAISGVSVFKLMLNKLIQYTQNIHNELMANRIQIGLMTKSMSIDMEFFDSPDYMDAMQATMVDSSALTNIVWNIFSGVSSIVSLISAFIMIGVENWLYSIVLTIASIPSALMSRRYTKALYGWRLSHTKEDRKMGYIQSLSGHRVFAGDIRLFNLKDYLVERYQNIWRLIITGRKGMMKRQLTAALLTAILPEICVFVVLIYITKGIFAGSNTVGDYTLYSGLLASLTGSLTCAIDAIAEIYEDKLKVDTVKQFESRANYVLDNGKRVLEGDIAIEFRLVSFRYPNTERFVLKNLSFSIAPKEKICLVGINGAGKSTIIKLLLRFYDVTDGQILINGHDIRDYTLQSLRRGFSTFFQQYDKYAFSLRDNIRISDLKAEDENDKRTIETIESVGAQELLKKAPKGLDTWLSRMFDPDGFEPSGGEAQKIALARAVYRDCSMIIFDEPSASLDPVSEMNLFENMQEIFEDKTALFTSHRLSIVHLADRIFLLDNGRIMEQGSHQELMALRGAYAGLYSLQAEKYKV